jgi:hypothetical protein
MQDLILIVTICLEGLADVVAFYWLTSMVENTPQPIICIFLAP